MHRRSLLVRTAGALARWIRQNKSFSPRAKVTASSLSLAFVAAFACGPQAALALDIAATNKALCVIVTPDRPAPADKAAAAQLQQYLAASTGGAFLTYAESDAPANSPKIFVGQCRAAKAAVPRINFSSLGTDGVVIRTLGPTQLLLAGNPPRGTLNAVTTFLEDSLGVRWWTSNEEFVPKHPTLSVTNLNTTYIPKFRYREAYYQDPLASPLFAVHCRLNGHMSPIPEALGGHYEFLGWCHTLYSLLPPAKYFARHPEWYSLVDGKRTTKNAQVCFSNPEMLKELTRNALKWIAENPTAGMISISQNDCLGNCQCERCRATDTAEGTPAASLLAGINAVAARIHKKYPDFLVETLAYQHTRHPPKNLKPAANVLIRLCSIEADGAHPLDSAANKAFADDLRGWAGLARNIFIWHYVTDFNFPTIPHPNFNALGPDLQFFAANHVVGVFEQADAGNILAGDMLPLRTWLLAHLMWDPSQSQAKLTTEFLTGYFGPAGPFLQQYLDTVNAPSKDEKFHAGCFNQDLSYLTDAVLRRCHELFNAAEQAVKDEPMRVARVKRERLVLESLELQRYDIPAQIAEQKKSIPDARAAATAAVEAYEAKARDWAARAILAGMRYHNYNFPTEQFAPGMITRGRTLIPALTNAPAR